MKKTIFTSIFASTVLFVQAQTAQVQIIHNSADGLASSFDVWINNNKLVDDITFRTATSFNAVQAGTPIDISITSAASTDTTNSRARFTLTLNSGETYVMVANGMFSSSGYNPIRPFNLDIYTGARQSSPIPTNTDILIHHGCTDAPTIDVRNSADNSLWVDDALYSNFSNYSSLPTADYGIDVTDATGTTVVASYQALFSTLNWAGSAITILASGFLDPSNNSNGPDFGLWAALPAGGALVQLPLVVSVDKTEQIENLLMFPNPAQDVLNLSFNAVENADLAIQISDVMGRLVYQQQLANVSGQQNIQIATQNLPSGAYQVTLRSNKGLTTQKLLIQK